jgi:acetyl esterase/lipase
MTAGDDLTRTLPESRRWLRDHLAAGTNVFRGTDPAAARRAIDELPSTDPVRWAGHWTAIAGEYAAQAEKSAESGDLSAARAAWWQAYQFAFLGRYPVPNHPAKQEAYDQARDYFGRAVTLGDAPAERVSVPFGGRGGEGSQVTFWVARPPGAVRPPVVLIWAGIDTWKEETYGYGQALRERGFATVHLDMPGTGESPVLAGPDAERQWDPVLDWLEASDLDASRVAVVGMSFGGYWAMKLAHTRRDRLAAAVNWGGGVHITFQPQWQEKSRNAASYLMDLMAARARIFGGSTFEDYVACCPGLSLLDQGVLDLPSAPLLLVNGTDDLQNSSDDTYLSLRYGDPKTVRMFPGGHMGTGPVMPAIVTWLAARLIEKGF